MKSKISVLECILKIDAFVSNVTIRTTIYVLFKSLSRQLRKLADEQVEKSAELKEFEQDLSVCENNLSEKLLPVENLRGQLKHQENARSAVNLSNRVLRYIMNCKLPGIIGRLVMIIFDIKNVSFLKMYIRKIRLLFFLLESRWYGDKKSCSDYS